MTSVMKKYAPKFDLLKKIMGKEDPVIVEIGAHFGEDSLRFLEIFPAVQLHCFEPDPRSIKIFKKYVQDKRATLYEVALANVNGTASFYQSYQPPNTDAVPEKYDWIDSDLYKQGELSNSGSSSLKRGYQFNKEESIEVSTQRFDSWLIDHPDIQDIDFAWIDVQGAEKDVLEGMGASITKIKLIWIEYGEMFYEDSMTRKETIEYLGTKGFIAVEKLSSQGSVGDLLFLREENV